MSHIGVGDAAKRIGGRAVDITGLFYRGVLRDDLCPIVSGRRLIPLEYLEQIRQALIRAGRPVHKEVSRG